MKGIEDCVAFVDLDDTLFSSVRKQVSADKLVPAATLADGSVICYSNPVQRFLFAMLKTHATIVPVTARNVAAIRRVLLPLHGPAVCSHGATILGSDGQTDAVWRQVMDTHLAEVQDSLVDFLEMARCLRDARGNTVRAWLVDDGGYPAYAVLKHPSQDEEAIRQLAQTSVTAWLKEHPGFRLHVNGNNLAVLPPRVRKAAAVFHLIEQFRSRGKATVVVGAGDSNSDQEYLSLCDIIVLPTRSQLAEALHLGVLEAEAIHA